jgi:hypothetical protein
MAQVCLSHTPDGPGALDLSYRPGRLAAAEAALRHLLLLLRDRTLCGLPPRERLKQVRCGMSRFAKEGVKSHGGQK